MEVSSTAATPEAIALVDVLLNIVMTWERDSSTRVNARRAASIAKVREAACALSLGVLRAWGGDTPRPAAFDQSDKGMDAIPGGRSAAKVVRDAMDARDMLRFTAHARHQNDWGAWQGRRSRVWPGPELLRLATDSGLTPANIRDCAPLNIPAKAPAVSEGAPFQCVRFHALKAKPGRPSSTRLSTQSIITAWPALRAQVEEYNAFAADFTVTGCAAPRWFRQFGPDVSLGGRWWTEGPASYQNMNKVERLRITINGGPVAEVDVHASQPSIMHALLGLELPADDLYKFDGTDRDTIKAWITSTLGNGAPKKRWSAGHLPHVKRYKVKDIERLVCARYPFLSDPAGAVADAAGLTDLANIAPPQGLLTHRLMGIEADALTAAMFDLKERFGILSLSMHDGLIVPASAAMAAEDALKSAYLGKANILVRTKVNHAAALPEP